MRKDDLYDIQCMKLVYLSENQDFKLGSLNFLITVLSKEYPSNPYPDICIV